MYPSPYPVLDVSPSPSPSPPPATNIINISSIAVSRTVNNNQVDLFLALGTPCCSVNVRGAGAHPVVASSTGSLAPAHTCMLYVGLHAHILKSVVHLRLCRSLAELQ